ncbi:MAG TPA: glycosyltransferase family 1 protein [Gemmatimonadaceae bacterium]|nr:glycosyltransferase family 1 protein [Gemmatimonadaceae bacterium]
MCVLTNTGSHLRILFCTDTYPPQVNGVSVVTAISVRGLSERGWTCAVVAPKYPPASSTAFARDDSGAHRVAGESITTIPSVPLPVYPDVRLSWPSVSRIRRAIAACQPDVVHCVTEFVIGRIGMREARRRGIPVTTSYHTDFARYTASYGVPWLREPVMRSIVRFHQRARRTFTPGRPAGDDLAARGVQHVEVWGRGVDIERFHPSRRDAALRETLGIGNRFAFLHVGRLAAEKGAALILDAYRAAVAKLPADSTRLVIAGEGPSRAALERDAPPGTIFLGFVDRERELPRLYASCDAFTFASTTETLGLVILEAMSSGIPVIAAPAGGVADHLRDGVNGIAYPAHDVNAFTAAMLSVVSDRAKRDALARGARATAEGLSWEKELDRLDASYREVLRK